MRNFYCIILFQVPKLGRHFSYFKLSIALTYFDFSFNSCPVALFQKVFEYFASEKV